MRKQIDRRRYVAVCQTQRAPDYTPRGIIIAGWLMIALMFAFVIFRAVWQLT